MYADTVSAAVRSDPRLRRTSQRRERRRSSVRGSLRGGDREEELRYTARRCLTAVGLKAAGVETANATFAARCEAIWGQGTTTVASDSTHFKAWDRNIFTEWHSRYELQGDLVPETQPPGPGEKAGRAACQTWPPHHPEASTHSGSPAVATNDAEGKLRGCPVGYSPTGLR
ncbi:Tn3 family transposase [Streptomyces sp. P9-A2]|uniref:Tn3 family transposase n=1 Tax=Streptomyces sp. P9-A2 TaxID=3072284 RepID=UPI003FCC640A